MTSVNQQKDNIKCNVVGVGFEFQMLSPAMIRILRWLEAHSASLESAWDVPRSISLEGIADGIGVVRSALFQPMSALEEDGLIQTRQAHVIGSGRRKRKVVHITQNGREMVKERTEEVPERRPKSTQKLKGQIPELTHLHGRRNELLRIRDAMQRGEPVHLRGMPGIGKSTLARHLVQEFGEDGHEVHWVQLDSYCDVHEAIKRMEINAPQILDVEGYASLMSKNQQILIFDDVHLISPRHEGAFSNLFKALEQQNIQFMLIGRDRDTFSIEGEYIELGSLEEKDAIELLNPELGDERGSIVETLGGHPLAILLYNESTSMPETDQDVRAYVEHVVLGEASAEVHDAMSPFLVLPFPVPADRMPEPDHVPLLDEHTLLRWGARSSTMEMQHLIRNVCKSSLDDSSVDALHASAISHWQKENDVLASILELHHRIQRGEEGISGHLSSRANELRTTYSGAFATLLDEALTEESEDLELIGLAAQHALNRAEVEVAKSYLSKVDGDQLASIRLQIAQFEGKKGVMDDLESMLETLDDSNEKLRVQLSVLSRSIDDLSATSSSEDFDRIERLLNQVQPPEPESERQIILTTIVVMRHALAIERNDMQGAEFLIGQLRGIAPGGDPLVEFLTTKTELKSIDSTSATAALTLKNAERIAMQLQQPLYKTSLLLLICEHLVETQLPRAQLIHAEIDIHSVERMEIPSAQRLVAKWWEVKSMFGEHDRVMALREAIIRYRSVGCPKRARSLSKQLHKV